MKKKELIKKIVLGLACISGFASCAIENDIPYPIVEAAITGMTVEGQRGPEDNQSNSAAVINNAARTVTLYVNDSVDITNLKITQLQVSNNAELLADSAACADYGHFPQAGFSSLDSIPVSSNTRMDFSKPVNFTLRTYQDYVWTVTVNQIISRNVEVEGQFGDEIIDANNRNVIIYVTADTDLSNIQVKHLNLGGEYGEVTPDPTTVHDFTYAQTFHVRYNWEQEGHDWTVYVYHTEEGGETSGDVFAMASRAILNGSIQSGKTPVVEYRESSTSSWTEVPSDDVTVSGTSYTAILRGLSPSTAYRYRVSVDGVAGEESSFTTVAAIALENGSLDNWSTGALSGSGNEYYIPNAEGSTFWGTGNSATAIYKTNVTYPTDDAYAGKAAVLASQSALGVKMAAGNLFAGDFERDGLDGILKFGRPFTSFPTGLRFYYKYTPATMQTVGGITQLPSDLEPLVGQPDSCHIYIALSDKSEPYEIRTASDDRQLFDKNDANIIAYGEFISSDVVTSYQQVDIQLTYRSYRTPKYLIIVCSASKYGDYYLAGNGSTLYLDELELLYE